MAGARSCSSKKIEFMAKYSSAPYVGSGIPVNRQTAIVASSSPKRIGVVAKPNLRIVREEELVPVPADGKISLRLASRCRFIPKAVVFRNKCKWLDPMDWEAAFDATLELLDEWYGKTMQFIDDKYLGCELAEGVELQWTYCYCLRNICRFLEIKYDEIVFQAFKRRSC